MAYVTFILFWMTMIGIQTVLLKCWRQRQRLIWLVANFLGIVLGFLVGTGLVYALGRWAPFDVLQDVQDSLIVLSIAVVGLALVVMVVQWLVLRGRIRLPVLWAVLNVLMAGAIWTFIIIQAGLIIFARDHIGLGILIALLAGGFVGGITGSLMQIIGLKASQRE